MIIDGITLATFGAIAGYLVREGVNHHKVKELRETIKEMKSKDESHEITMSGILADNIKITEALDRSFLDRTEGE